jgi:hypothetical protein
MSTEVEHDREREHEEGDSIPVDRASSVLGQISKRREERSENEELLLPIPTWGGDLVGNYRLIDQTELERIANRVRSGRPDPTADKDFLAKSCYAILIRDPESGQLQQLEDESGMPVAYSMRLAQALGLDPEQYDTARKLIGHLFQNNQLAVAGHAGKIIQWMQDTSQEVDGAVLGESVGLVRLS